MFPSLRPLLNKGGAGRYISRQESVVRLQPIARRHLDLLMAYDAHLGALPDGPALTEIEAMMPYLRTEVAKMSETILSLGGTPPSGAGETAMSVPEESDRDRIQGFLDAEKDFGDSLRDEAEAVHHHERTRAILNHNADASTARTELLRGILARQN